MIEKRNTGKRKKKEDRGLKSIGLGRRAGKKNEREDIISTHFF